MKEETLFLGRPVSYWTELNKKPRELDVEHLIQEIADLRGKLSATRKRLNEINIILASGKNF